MTGLVPIPAPPALSLIGAATAWTRVEKRSRHKSSRGALGDVASYGETGGGREKVKLMFRKAQRAEEDRDETLSSMKRDLSSLTSDVADVQRGLSKLTSMVQLLLDQSGV